MKEHGVERRIPAIAGGRGAKYLDDKRRSMGSCEGVQGMLPEMLITKGLRRLSAKYLKRRQVRSSGSDYHLPEGAFGFAFRLKEIACFYSRKSEILSLDPLA